MISSAKTLTVAPRIFHPVGKSCLWICTAASPQMGFGHLKRSMALARSLLDCSMPLFLIDSQDHWSQEQLAGHGWTFINEPLDEVWFLLPDPTAILIDTRLMTRVDHFIASAKHRGIPVVSIHDLGLDPLPSDILIDGSIAPNFCGFPSQDATFYGGAPYMILDPVYRFLHQQEKQFGKKIKSIFVNLGGGNSSKYFAKVLEGLRLWARELEVIGVPGFASWGQKNLGRRDWFPLHFHWEDESIGQYCFQADLAITAGGLAAYEALCTGTPLLALSYDRLQQATIRTLARAGACMDLGPGDDFDPAQLPETLSMIESDHDERRLLSHRGRNIVDGRGTERVSRIFRQLICERTALHLLEGIG